MIDEEVFADGNMTPVVRRGDEVRRRRWPWWEASTAVLRHLEMVGFSFAPRLLGYDGEVERLAYVPGESMPASLDGYDDDATIIGIGRMIRGYHDAMATFSPPPELTWPVMVGAPQGDGTICHNDLAPWNTIVRDRSPVAFIDWDLVAPGTRTWDLAYAAWRFAPLYPGERFGPPSSQLRRVRLLLDAYALPRPERADFLAMVRRRMRSSYATVETWGRAGVPGFARLYAGRMHAGTLDDIAWLDGHIDAEGMQL